MKPYFQVWPLLIMLFAFNLVPNDEAKTPLASKLSDFTVYSKIDHIKVTWVTRERNEIIRFDIQRSHDGKRFETMKKIDSNGDEPSVVEYFEVDNDPLLGWSYYRIRQVLVNKDTAYSGVAPVFFGLDRLTKGEYIAAKNPLEDIFPVDLASFHDEQILLVLRDGAGGEFYVNQKLTVKGGRLSIKAKNEIAQGIYIITASSKDALVGLEIFAD